MWNGYQSSSSQEETVGTVKIPFDGAFENRFPHKKPRNVDLLTNRNRRTISWGVLLGPCCHPSKGSVSGVHDTPSVVISETLDMRTHHLILVVWLTQAKIPIRSMHGSMVPIPASQIWRLPKAASKGIEIAVPVNAIAYAPRFNLNASVTASPLERTRVVLFEEISLIAGHGEPY